MMKAWTFVCMMCCVVGSCHAQGGTTGGGVGTAVSITDKEATVFCIKNEATNVLEMTFRLSLMNNPQGALHAIDKAEYARTPFNVSIISPVCVESYDSTNKVYTISSAVDLSNTNTNDQNVCGRIFQVETSTNVVYHEWHFYYQSIIPTGNLPWMISKSDAVYTTICRMDNLTSNRLVAQINVESPGLNQITSVSQLDVKLIVQVKTGTNAYTDVTSGVTVNAGDTIRLMVIYDRGANYIQNLNWGSIYVINSQVSAFSTFSPGFMLVNSNGCAVTTGSTAPTFPLTGFKGSNLGTLNTLVTSDFLAWKLDSSNQLFFRIYFGACPELSTLKCTDHCRFNTGVTESAAGRKKRDIEDVGYSTVSITIGDRKETTRTAEQSSETNMAVIIGATVGAVVLLVLCVLVCMIAMMKRRKLEKKCPGTNYPEIIPNYANKY